MGRRGRPPLPVGTFGEIWTRPDKGGYIAKCFYRDHDGVSRQAQRKGPSKNKARTNLKEALAKRNIGESPDDLNTETKLHVFCEKWWDEFKESSKSPNTKRLYEGCMNNQIIPAMGELRIREVTLGRIGMMIKSVAKDKGEATAKVTRSVLSSILAFAGRHDAIDRNPTKDIERIEGKPKKAARALELDEVRRLRALVYSDARAKKRDLPEFLDSMLATGLRIGEASAIVWGAVEWTEGAEAFEVRGTVVREKGKGLYIKPKPKTDGSYGSVEIPSWMVTILKARFERMRAIDESRVAPDAPVFPAPLGGLRDPSNTSADLREVFDQPDKNGVPTTEWTWVTSHSWGRKTVATLMDEAGLSARDAADQLRHRKVSMTQDHYFGRKKRATKGKAVLEAIAGG